jgi:hypothetical protein
MRQGASTYITSHAKANAAIKSARNSKVVIHPTMGKTSGK